MQKLFFGKISKRYPIQLEENYYAGGPESSSWYGELKVGDYVFPIYQGEITKLWRVKAFEKKPNPINPEGIIQFEPVGDGFSPPISLASNFIRYRHFDLDLNLLNKCMKSTAKEKIGFFPITTMASCPSPEAIDFADVRSIYIAFKEPYKSFPNPIIAGDIRILIDDPEQLNIAEIQIFQDGSFQKYNTLDELYQKKNAEGERYSLSELLDYAEVDHATKKEKYLRAVLESLQSDGYFTVISPVRLYDNILVGRKKTFRKAAAAPDGPKVIPSDEPEITTEELDEYQEYVDLLKFNPNLILYGPPGTGKTYSVEKIIEAFEFDRTKAATSFQDLQDAGRARFVTFHQSFSYEEFVEGLRPVVATNGESIGVAKDNSLQYQIQPGLLLQIANKAVISQMQKEFPEEEFGTVGESNKIWKISLGSRGKEENVYKNCISTGTAAIGWLPEYDLDAWDKEKIYKALQQEESTWSSNPTNDADSTDKFVNGMQIGDILLVFANVKSIRAIGVVTGDYQWNPKSKDQYNHRRPVKWLRTFEKPLDIVGYNGGVWLTMKTVYELSRLKFSDVKEMLEIGSTPSTKKNKNPAVPYFLVIDEINRGNISKIFGELITLLEKDKRDKIRVQLPYSQTNFTLPSNLYFIGTMNTADRSIAILDTALRRRFVFKELIPNPEIIRKESPLNDDTIDLASLLENINRKITEKLDRDHQIGHSYFLEAYSISQFKSIWYYQILPLLMEYFYNDGELIASIVGHDFIDAKSCEVKWMKSNEHFKTAILKLI